MKNSINLYISICLLIAFITSNTFSQGNNCKTYTIDYKTSLTCPACLNVCSCTNGFGSGLAVKNYTDAPPPGFGAPVTSISFASAVSRCPGAFTGLINGVNVGQSSQTVTCACNVDICGPSSPSAFAGSPAGYNIGGNNTFQVQSQGVQVCYQEISLTICYSSLTPTLNEWGLINFALLLLAFGTVIAMQRQKRLALNNGSSVSMSDGFSFNLFFQDFKSNINSFIATFLAVFMSIGLAFGIAIRVFQYESTSADLGGSFIAAIILSLMIHSIFINTKK